MEPLLGKNRGRRRYFKPRCPSRFPDTIYDVIFDDRYAIQFHPVTSPIICNTPSEESIIAAKACLEGFSGFKVHSLLHESALSRI